tara:strand:+ start:219 stop:1769 length:1551 start_codon:yes stop_codon:yes gene_type:complete
MKLLSTSLLNHDSGFSFMEDGSLVDTILFERYTRRKHEPEFIHNLFVSKQKETQTPTVSISQFLFYDNGSAKKLGNILSDTCNVEVDIKTDDHHKCHAHCGYYTSSFDEALCIVIDGAGSLLEDHKCESESVYIMKGGKISETVYKRFSDFYKIGQMNEDFMKNPSVGLFREYNWEDFSIGSYYQNACLSIGMRWCDGGKLMGLAQYKDHKDKLPSEYSGAEWHDKVDFAYEVQKTTEKKVLKIVEKYSKQTGIKNIILSGGVFLNCVSNYNLVKNLPNLKFHVDPMCSDNGISTGKALMSYIEKTDKLPNRIKNSYLGYSDPYINCYGRGDKVDYSDIIDILLSGDIVALFQGKSEVGQRSLGNRSLLFDARNKDGRTIVNEIKKREDYRPFAATVLQEYAHEWFDLKTLEESPTMSFAVDAYDKTIKEVPSVIHADGTCRIQTVTEEQNPHFYNLILEFYKRTGVPMLLNTSFNLAGEPLVETYEQALFTLVRSKLKYLYIPEKSVLVQRPIDE